VTREGRGRARLWGARFVLVVGALWVGAAGLAYPLDLPRLSSWPHDRGWFMFSSDDGWQYRLVVEGTFADGARREVDLSPWFEVKVTAAGGREQELPRNQESMRALAAFVCAHANAGAAPAARLMEVDVVDWAWPRARGRRLAFDEVAPTALRRTVWIRRYVCEALP
jgi:hypothetical protein